MVAGTGPEGAVQVADVERAARQLDEQTHVAIPEADYEKVATLDGCVAYLADALARPGSAS